MTLFLLFAAACGVAYYIGTAKTRRERAIEGRLRGMLASRRSEATFPELFFDAARKYAIENGDLGAERDAAGATLLINGRTWFVVFSRNPLGSGTVVSITDPDAFERAEAAFVAGASASARTPPTTNAARVAAAYEELCVAIGDDSMTGPRNIPEWVSDEQRLKAFVADVADACEEQNIPAAHVLMALVGHQMRWIVFDTAASAEQRGEPYALQVQAVAMLLAEGWDPRVRQFAREKGWFGADGHGGMRVCGAFLPKPL